MLHLLSLPAKHTLRTLLFVLLAFGSTCCEGEEPESAGEDAGFESHDTPDAQNTNSGMNGSDAPDAGMSQTDASASNGTGTEASSNHTGSGDDASADDESSEETTSTEDTVVQTDDSGASTGTGSNDETTTGTQGTGSASTDTTSSTGTSQSSTTDTVSNTTTSNSSDTNSSDDPTSSTDSTDTSVDTECPSELECDSGICLDGVCVECSGDGDCDQEDICNVTTHECTPHIVLGLHVNTDQLLAGELVTASILLTNPGTQTETVDVTLQLPLGIYNANLANRSPGADCGANCGAGDSVTWTVEDLEPGESTVLWVRPSVYQAEAGDELEFKATVTTTHDLNLEASASAVVGSARALNLRIDAPSDPIVSGSEVTYRVHYASQSADPLDPVTLVFHIPEGTSHASGEDEMEIDLGRLPAKGGGVIDVRVTVDEELVVGTQLAASAEVFEGDGEDNFTSSSTHVAVGATPLLASVEVNSDAVVSGDLVAVYITVSNPSANVVTTDVNVRLPPGVYNAAANNRTPGATCGANCGAGDTVTWTIEDLGPGESTVLWIRPSVYQAVEGGLLPFEVELLPVDTNTRVRASNTARVDTAKPMSLQIDASESIVAPGGKLTYAVHYGNLSADPLDPVSLTLHVPDGLEHESEESELVFEVGRLGPSEGGIWEVELSVDDSLLASSQIEVVADIVEESAPHRATRTTVRTTVGDLPFTASLELNPDPVYANGLVDAQLTVTNPSSETATIDARMHLPLGVYNATAANRSPGGVCGANCGAGDTVTWTIEDLEPGESTVVWVRPSVYQAKEGGLLHFDAELTSVGSTVVTRASSTVNIHTSRPLALVIDSTASPVAAGDSITYQLHYSNEGEDPLDPVSLVFYVPEGTQHESDESALVFDVGRLNGGDGGVYEVTVTVDDDIEPGTRQLKAFAEISEDGDVNNAALATNWVPVGSDQLDVTIEVPTDTVENGDLLLAEVTVLNSGDAVVTADVRIQLPLGVYNANDANRSEDAVCGANCGAGDVVRWTIEDLEPGNSALVWIRPSVYQATEGALLTFEADVRPVGSNVVTQTSGSVRVLTP